MADNASAGLTRLTRRLLHGYTEIHLMLLCSLGEASGSRPSYCIVVCVHCFPGLVDCSLAETDGAVVWLTLLLDKLAKL